MMASDKQELRGAERKPVHSCCWHATTARALTLITPFSDFVLFVVITGFLLNIVATVL
jgi:hypothetical protein